MAILVRMAVAVLLTCGAGLAGERVIEQGSHHLRFGEGREWATFPAESEGAALVVHFRARANDVEETIRVRHADLKQQWIIRLNDKLIAKLPLDENPMVTAYAIAPHALREGENELTISCAAAKNDPADDIQVGPIEMVDRPLVQVLKEAGLDVQVVDEQTAEAIPSRLTIVNPQGEMVQLGTASSPTLAVRPGVVYLADGKARLSLPAGRYTLYAGRGFEYSVATASIKLAPGAMVTKRLAIRRVVRTAGYAACDTHIHTLFWSRHGDATARERMITLAGEGIEVAISAEHNLQVDYSKEAKAAGLDRYFTSIIGNEVTTPSLGHFNVFPIPTGTPLINWRGKDWGAIGRAVEEVPGNPVVILNHARDIHGGFRPFDPLHHLSITGEQTDSIPPPSNAMEVINSGAVQTDPMLLFRDWFGMLNRGQRLTPIGASDSHDVSRFIVGQGRTYVKCDDAEPGRIDAEQVRRAIRAGRVLVSYGLLTDITVQGKFGPGDLVSAGGDVDVRVRVFGPEWTWAERVVLYANGVLVREASIPRPAGEAAGLKWTAQWMLPHPHHDIFLVAIATGPGVSGLFWPTAKPYQPMSPDLDLHVIGATAPVWIDADGSGGFQSALEIARGVIKPASGIAAVVAALEKDDEAVAAQAASLLHAQMAEGFEEAWKKASAAAAPATRRGFEAFLTDWHAHEHAVASKRSVASP